MRTTLIVKQAEMEAPTFVLDDLTTRRIGLSIPARVTSWESVEYPTRLIPLYRLLTGQSLAGVAKLLRAAVRR